MSFLKLILASLILVPLAAKSPITHEQMWKMKRVGAPAVSPDGRWVVFPVTEPAYDPKDNVTDLWLVSAEGGHPPQRLTHTKGTESDPVWSPDSGFVAFTARRDGDEQSQIYLLPINAAGEARRLTSLSTGASGPQFSPDGTMVLFQSSVYPGAADDDANRKAAADLKARKYNARVFDSFPIRRWDQWVDERRPHIFVQPVDGSAPARDLLAATQLAAAPGFSGVSTNSGADLQPAWSPDGRSIIFTATQNQHESAKAFVLTHLYEVALSGGEPKAITSGKLASYAEPQFTPNGRGLLALAEANDGKPYHLSRLARIEWPERGAPRLLDASWDRSAGKFGIAGDNSTVFVLAEEHGLEKLFQVPATGGNTRLAHALTEGVYTNLSVARRSASPVLVANWGSAVAPAEVVRIDPAGGRRPITFIHTEATREIDWQPVEHFWFTSRKGREVHNMIVRPPAFDPAKKYPLVVFIHGGPHTMSRDEFHTRWNLHLLAAPGYVILMTNYTGSTGFGEKFAQLIQHDPLQTPGDEINQAVDEALKRYFFIDGSRMAAGGASYGGHLSNWLQATTTRFRCLYSHAGLINLESQWGTSDGIYHREINNGGPVWEQGPVWREQNPIRRAAQFRTPVLLTVGEQDFRVPLNNTLEYWSALKRLDVPSRLVVFPDENHWILKGENNRYFYQELQGWLARWLAN